MNTEIVAKDKNGVLRCYGIGTNHADAISQCLDAAREYLKTRSDIKTLYLYNGDTDKPIIDGNMYQHWEVSL